MRFVSSHFLGLVWTIGIFSMLPAARAVEFAKDADCLTGIVGALSLGQEHKYDWRFYTSSRSILFLSDGSPQGKWIEMGPTVARDFPQARVVSTDFPAVKDRGRGNFTRQVVDNRRPFPWDDDSFDLIVLRRGLCVCEAAQCCAGFAPQSRETRRFFREVVRVLDKQAPSARVVLHGEMPLNAPDLEAWKNYLFSIEEEFGVRAILHTKTHTDEKSGQTSERFVFIEIRPGN